MMRHLAFCMLLAVATGCDRRDRFAAPDPSPVPETPRIPERGAYLSVSDPSPEPGATIVVTATLRLTEGLSLGSFKVRLGYDSTKLEYVEEIPGQDMLRVVNPRAGDVIIVGAASSPSPDGKLFAFRMHVADPAGVSSLVLRVDELNDADFKDQRATVTQASTIIHDRSLAKLVPHEARPSTPDSPARVAGASATQVPVIDSISPRSGELEHERVTDITIYGKGFAAVGNTVQFGEAEVTGLMSERGGTVIRFSAPVIRARGDRVSIRVKHDGIESNARTFRVRDE